MQTILQWLQRRADNVAVGLLTVIFLVFILQIVSRYVFQQPIGWTLEACLLAWVWLVFWSSAFILKDEDHVRFTVLYDVARPKTRQIFKIFTAICIVVAFAISLPPTWDFVSFMRIEKTSLLKIRFDYVFGIYLVFSIAMVTRYLWRIVGIIRSRGGNSVT